MGAVARVLLNAGAPVHVAITAERLRRPRREILLLPVHNLGTLPAIDHIG